MARAHNGQAEIYARWLAFFETYDVLLLPAASVSPFPHAQLFVEEINGEHMPTYMRWLALSYAPTMAFATAAAIPCGVDPLGMPFGLQIAGPRGADRKVLAVAHALEQAFAERAALRRPTPDLGKLTGDLGMNAAISAPQPEAVEAGADILRAGGNAVDAAVACALVQTVVDPIMCGLAGFGSMPSLRPRPWRSYHARLPTVAPRRRRGPTCGKI